MAKQFPASPGNKKISHLYKRIREGSLILQPEFQRKFVWNSSHQESFIDTILRGLPFPEIYTAQSGVDIEKIETREVIVDGQQRLSTIVQYIDEDKESRTFGKKVPKFKDLPEDDQKDFLNYNIVIRDLGDVSSDLIREIFNRINQTKFGLEQVEIQNAVYDGEFISTAKEILEEIDKEHIPIFSDSEMSRMSDLHFILLVMTTLENAGYFTLDKEIERFIASYNDEYPRKDKIKPVVVRVLNDIKNLNLEPDSIWYRKSNFFTLLVELCTTSGGNYDTVKQKLIEFEENILANKYTPKGENDFSTYYSYMYTGTNQRQARVVRSELFKKHVLS